MEPRKYTSVNSQTGLDTVLGDSLHKKFNSVDSSHITCIMVWERYSIGLKKVKRFIKPSSGWVNSLNSDSFFIHFIYVHFKLSPWPGEASGPQKSTKILVKLVKYKIVKQKK